MLNDLLNLLSHSPLSWSPPPADFGGGGGDDLDVGESEDFDLSDESDEGDINLGDEGAELDSGSTDDSSEDIKAAETFLKDPANKEFLERKFGNTSGENLIRSWMKGAAVSKPDIMLRARSERSQFRESGSSPAMNKLVSIIDRLTADKEPKDKKPSFAERLQAIRDNQDLSFEEREKLRDELFLEVLSGISREQATARKEFDQRVGATTETLRTRKLEDEAGARHEREEAEVKAKFPYLAKTSGALSAVWDLRDAYFLKLKWAIEAHPSGRGNPKSPNYDGNWGYTMWERHYKPLLYFAQNSEKIRRAIAQKRVELHNETTGSPGSAVRPRSAPDLGNLPRDADAADIIHLVDGA